MLKLESETEVESGQPSCVLIGARLSNRKSVEQALTLLAFLFFFSFFLAVVSFEFCLSGLS